MKERTVSKEEAEAAYTKEMAGDPFDLGEIQGAIIKEIRLPEEPRSGGSQGKGWMPLTFVYEADGEEGEVTLQDGPEVDEVRAFLQATIEDLDVDERVRLWFEKGISRGLSC